MKIKVVVEKIEYKVIEGAEQTYTIKEDTEARFRIDADYSLFNNKVYVDNVLVDSSNYTSKSGSTIIVLNKDYVDTLAAGEHTLKVAFADGGEAETTFTIVRKAENNNNNENNTPSKPEDKEEMALTLNGKKRRLKKRDFMSFASKCGIAENAAEKMLSKMCSLEDKLLCACEDSYLPEKYIEQTKQLITTRIAVLKEG